METLLLKFTQEYPFVIKNFNNKEDLCINNGFYISGYVDKK